jgi:hypothetical protein
VIDEEPWKGFGVVMNDKKEETIISIVMEPNNSLTGPTKINSV